MFSRFLTSISKPVLSPKALLSEFIATALNVYFVIDPALIESNLLSDTKIVLRNIQLKPLPLQPSSSPLGDNNNINPSCSSTQNLVLVGSVDEIEFKWTWGGAADGSTSFVRETMLTIRGAKFSIVVASSKHDENSDMDDEYESVSTDPEKSASNNNRIDAPLVAASNGLEKESYAQKYIQQILDHLTLIITDMEVTIDVNETDLFILNAADIQLVSFGHSRQLEDNNYDGDDDEVKSSTLVQRLSLGLLRGDIHSKLASSLTSSSSDNILPCLEIFGYAAMIKRISGKRFVGSIWNGLEVTGETTTTATTTTTTSATDHTINTSTDDTKSKPHDVIYIHGGQTQIRVLCTILNKLFAMLKPTIVIDEKKETSEFEIESTPTEDSHPSGSTPSSFHMEIPGLKISLPNGSSLQFPRGVFTHCADGSKSMYTGTEGIILNGSIPLLELKPSMEWVFDVRLFQFSLHDAKNKTNESMTEPYSFPNLCPVNVATMLYKEGEIKQLIQGCNDALQLIRSDVSFEILEEYESSSSHTSQKCASDHASKNWDLIVNGIITIRIECDLVSTEDDVEWIEIEMKPLLMTIADNVLSGVKCHGIMISNSSFNNFSLSIPGFTMAEEICFNAGISATVESFALLQQIQNFVSRSVLTMSNDNVTENTTSDSITTPFPVKIPEIKVHINNTQTVATIAEISAHDKNCKIASVIVAGVMFSSEIYGTSLSTVGSAEINQIKSFEIPGQCQLAEPINDVKLTYCDGTIEMMIPVLNMFLSSDQGGKIESAVDGNETTASTSLPFKIIASIGKSKITMADNNFTELEQLNITAKPLYMKDISREIGSNAAEMEINIQTVQHSNLMTLNNLHAIGVCYAGQYQAVHSSYLSVNNVAVVAGFSTFDWKAMIGKGPEAVRVPIKLPNTQIAPFQVSVSYKGKVLSTENTLVSVPAFSGDDQTDSDDFIQHVTRHILKKSPSFVTNAEFLGVSITDNIGTHAGRTLLGATLAGSVAGSVVGVVAVDAVKGAVSAGKSFRGVSQEDGYKFGDFTRGVVHSMKAAPKAGVSGTAQSVGTYATDNKSRLAGAGGSGLGMVIGSAVAGPVGFFAGAYLGGLAGSKAIDDTPKADSGQDVTQRSVDLLDLGTTYHDTFYDQKSQAGTGRDISQRSENLLDIATYNCPRNDQHSTSANTISPDMPHEFNTSHANTGITHNSENDNRYHSQQATLSTPIYPAMRQPASLSQQGFDQVGAEATTRYRFGDLTKSVIAKGKQNSGRNEKDGYKFGDFTRGLFGK